MSFATRKILETTMLSKICQTEKSRTEWFHSYMGYEIKSNKWANKANKNSGIENSMIVTSGKGVRGIVKGKAGQIYGIGKRFDFGWWSHNAIC